MSDISLSSPSSKPGYPANSRNQQIKKVTTQAKFRYPCWIQPKQGWGVEPLKVATSESKILAPCLCIVAQ